MSSSKVFSLQRTLAVRFSLTMFVALLTLSLWVYLGVRHTLVQQLDRSLQGSAQLQVNSIIALRSQQASGPFPLDGFIRDINRFVAVRDSTGAIVGSNSARAHDLVLDPVAFEHSRRGAASFATHVWRGSHYRSIYLALPRFDSSPAAVVQVEASLAPLEGNLRTILLSMLGTVALATLATAVGAGWLARSAVRPVREITDQARAVTGEVPGHRLTAQAKVAEFQGLTKVINEMLDRLERATQWHRRLIRDLSHDLRTPVTAMRAGVEVALWKDRSPTEYRRILSSTMEEIDRLSLICDALVLLGRLQAGDVSLDLAVLDARLLAREAVAQAQDGAENHTVILFEPEQPVPIRADVRLMRMVLNQLLDNARRYTPAGSHIEVAVTGEADHAVIVVEDDGTGLEDDVLPHLFEPFYRNDTARAREGGPGLGLTATAAIIALHGGTVTASRGTKGGLRVTIRLARSASVVDANDRSVPLRSGGPQPVLSA